VDQTDSNRFDHVIVGGGSAGAVLGARLSEDAARSVLVLEAGPAGPLDSDADLLSNVSFASTGRDWGMRARVNGDRELDYPQGKFLGGGSSVNGALAFRGSPADYDGWAAQGNPRWSWDHLLPCFRRLERDLDFGADHAVHGEDGPVPIVRWGEAELLPVQQAFADACTTSGIPWVPDHNHPASTGIGPLPMNRAEGRRISTALAYLAPALARPNLVVRGGAQVDRVRIDHGRATGVVVVQDGDVTLVEAGEVIVSAGTIHSPAILWRSGIGPAGDLQQLGIACLVDNAAVGANLMDHPGLFHFLHPGRHAPDLAAPQFQLGARWSSDTTGVDNDLLLSMMNFWDLSSSPDFEAVVGAPVVVVLTCGVHEPRSRGRVVLSSADPDAAPHIDLACSTNRPTCSGWSKACGVATTSPDPEPCRTSSVGVQCSTTPTSTTMSRSSGTRAPSSLPGTTHPGPAGWVRRRRPAPSSTMVCVSTALMAYASWTPPSCRRSSARRPTSP
jgi:choline dehydrogenase